MSRHDSVAVLGVGMHPWGAWGRSFIEYGVVAARAALADAGIAWRDVQMVVGGETIRNGYPGYVSGSAFSQALGWQGAPVASCYAACASGAQALATGRAYILAGLADVVLVVGAGRHPEGLLRPGRRRPPGRPGLAPVPAPRRDEPGVLRPVRAPPDGAARLDRGRLRRGEGEERPGPGPSTRWPGSAPRSTSRRSWTPRWSATRCACSRSARRATARPRWCWPARTTRAGWTATPSASARSRR